MSVHKTELKPDVISSSSSGKRSISKFKDLEDRFFGYFLMSRPYSLTMAPMMILAAKSNECGSSFSFESSDAIKCLVPLACWAGLCWGLESSHKHEHRPQISSKIALSATIGGSCLAAYFNPVTLVFSGIHAVAGWLYGKKERTEPKEFFINELTRRVLNNYSFVVRGIAQSAAFLTCQLLYSQILTFRQVIIASAIGMFVAARNLIGDLRDSKYDKDTFCVRYGIKASKYVVGGLKLSAALVLSVAMTPLVAIPLIAGSLVQCFHKNYQNLHRLEVYESIATLGNIFFAGIGSTIGMLVSSLFYLTALFDQIYYNQVARRSNSDWLK